jgi:hypothetical protein
MAARLFMKAGVDGATLLALDDAGMVALGIEEESARKKLAGEIDRIRNKGDVSTMYFQPYFFIYLFFPS